MQEQSHQVRSNDAREPTNLLLVEDDVGLVEMLSDALAGRGYRVWHAADASEVGVVLAHCQPDIVIVDLMLPDRNGLLLCNELKGRSAAPVIICSATKRKDDAALGFKLGADDFVAKPFTVDELDARMRRVLHHPPRAGSNPTYGTKGVQYIGDLAIDRTRCLVTLRDGAVQLTPTEYRLLCELASRPSEVLSRRELVERVWGFHDAAVVRSLDVHMRRLRAKLRPETAGVPHVATRRGFGYQLVQAQSTTARQAPER